MIIELDNKKNERGRRNEEDDSDFKEEISKAEIPSLFIYLMKCSSVRSGT